MKKINIGILGLGTVGTGVAKMLADQRDLITSRLGAEIAVKYIADLDITTDRGITFEEGVLTTDAFMVVSDPDIDIVVELIGGETIAKELTLKALANGKHVVTANKALIAGSGNALFETAAEHGVEIAFEASVAGCIPIIKTIRESLAGNRINSVSGILNGTCNYILSKITREGATFQDALKEAQDSGFAEADPTLDIEGIDTAHKLAIMTALAYGMEINLDDIYVEGITGITPQDIQFAAEFGYRIKLLAISKNMGDVIDARVHPTMIPENNLFASVNNSVNAVDVSGDASEDMFLVGHGAGMMPTASAILSDLIDISRNILSNTHMRVPPLSYIKENIRTIPILPIDEIYSRYYFRFSAINEPGVLSKISGILGDYGISIRSVHQIDTKNGEAVPVVMLSSPAREKDVRNALADIEKLDITRESTILIRIEENGK